MTPTRTRPARRRWLALGLGLAALLALATVMALRPATANALGYALPGARGLPGHFTYQGVTYSNRDLCAGDSSCAGARATRWAQADFVRQDEWPLTTVGAIPTLFGPAHTIYQPGNDPSMSGAGGPNASDARPFTLFLEDPAAPGWYYLYQRPGGP
ncbi:MAG TPA: hypothetical protein VF725_00045 [Ktedonobacterales bacterium]